MDKYEYQVCADQIKSLIKERRFSEAMDIADTIDWRRVKSFSMLCTVSEIYKITKHYSEARDILLLAYERYPDRANVVYALCELAIKLDDISESVEYYKEYVRLKPHDTNRYVLLYKIYEAQDVPLEEKISLLEEFKKAEYTEKWAYELAVLYHKDGQETKCVETCDELVLWFGEGPYVKKALELKMQHAPLTSDQQRKYDGDYEVPPYSETDTEDDIRPMPYNTAPMRTTGAYEAVSNAPNTQGGNYSDIQVRPVSNDKFSTMNLQEELAKNMEEFYASQNEVMPAPYYGSTRELYEPSQQQFMNQINQAGSAPGVQQSAQPSYEAQMQAQQAYYQQAYYQQQQSQPIQEYQQQPQQYYQQAQSQNYEQQYYEQAQQPEQQPVKHYEEPVQPVFEEKPIVEVSQQPETPAVAPMTTDQLPVYNESSMTVSPASEPIKNQTNGIEQTNDIMSQLIGVIPGYEAPVQAQDKPLAQSEQKEDDSEVKVNEEVIRDDDKGVVTRTTIPSPIFDRENNVKRTESGAVINGPLKSSLTGEIPDFLPTSAVPQKGDILPSGHKLTLEEEYGGNIAQIRKDDEELVKKLTGEIPDVVEEIPEVTEEPEDYGVTEDIAEIDQPELPEDEEETKADSEMAQSEEDRQIPPLQTTIIEEEQVLSETEEEVEEEPEEVVEEDGEDVAEEPIVFPYDVDNDIDEIEELEMIDQPDEVDDMLKTRPIPVEEIEARQKYEAGIEDDGEEVVETPQRQNHPKYMNLDRARSRRDFDENEEIIFGRYEGIEELKAQIVDVMDDISMEPGHGNVIVMGSELFGRKDLSIDIVKAIQMIDSSFTGKVAKISGEALNKKNIPGTLLKLSNGALVVENAGGLTPVTVNAITEALLEMDDPIIVVLEDDKDAIEPLLSGCSETRTVFDARITVGDFSDNDLVSYAKGYANELEYSIDEMGMLALHTRISEMQTSDHRVSVDEVIDIVDEAIYHVDRKNMGHMMDALLGKRYDDNDFIILREKDFLG